MADRLDLITYGISNILKTTSDPDGGKRAAQF